MINTYTSYQLLTRDLGKSLDRVGKEPMVQRDTEYYLANITKVTSAEEFVNDYRLFNYAMKAHGLEDMAYAKAFMLKALKEGVDDPDSFANKLVDKRYAEFVKSFNFAAYGEKATTYTVAVDPVVDLYLAIATPPGGKPSEGDIAATAFYAENIGKVKTIDQFLHKDNELLLGYALVALGLEGSFEDKKLLRTMLEGGHRDPESPANKHENEAWLTFVKTFDFEGLGERATSYNTAQQPSVDKFLRQTLEQNAGMENEGVRLALYFERMAPTITSAYQLLGDPALAKLTRTLLQLPDAIAQLDVDKQAALIEKRINIEDFQDPEKLSKLVTRFTTLWEVQNPSTPIQSTIVSLFQPVEFGISYDTLLAIASMRR
mgnify:CR=1 FL=1